MEEIIIRGGRVIDGTGRAAFRADVAVSGGKITAIGDLSCVSAAKELDAASLVVAPGFIDMHAHSDTSFLKDTSGASKLFQGVTTEVTGQCGSSPFPASGDGEGEIRHCASFEEFAGRFEAEGHEMAVNQAMMTGHGSLRAAVMGYADRKAAPEEIERMRQLLRADLQAGAWGMSMGLEYAPGCFADEQELAALGEVVREFDALMPCHMRSEGLRIDEAIDELTGIAKASGAKVHISHLKLDNFRVHGRAAEVWERIERERLEGVRISTDSYPFTASCTSLTIRCPRWSLEGGEEALLELLQSERRQEIVEGIRQHYFNRERAHTCLFNDDGGYWPEIVGKRLDYVAEEYLHTTDYAEAAAQVLVRTRAQAGGIFFVMDEADMLYFLSRDNGIGSDGWALPGDETLLDYRPHPRSYAALSEFFRLVRERELCTLEEAVRRVTSKAADVLGITDRGRLLEGMAADIVVFDENVIAPRASYLEPVRLSAGMRHILVNGGIAMEDGVQTAWRGGRLLRKSMQRME